MAIVKDEGVRMKDECRRQMKDENETRFFEQEQFPTENEADIQSKRWMRLSHPSF
jgi:hypothetical protein